MMDRPEDGLERLRRKLLLLAIIVIAIAGLYWLVLPRQDSDEYATETPVNIPVESDDIIWYVGEVLFVYRCGLVLVPLLVGGSGGCFT